MARIVVKTAQGNFELKPQKKSVFICMCGLSKNQPFCDGSHKKTLDEKEKKIYSYDEDGNRIDLEAEECCGNEKDECCGGGCCQDKK